MKNPSPLAGEGWGEGDGNWGAWDVTPTLALPVEGEGRLIAITHRQR